MHTKTPGKNVEIHHQKTIQGILHRQFGDHTWMEVEPERKVEVLAAAQEARELTESAIADE